jgi:hypothetical protein
MVLSCGGGIVVVWQGDGKDHLVSFCWDKVMLSICHFLCVSKVQDV